MTAFNGWRVRWRYSKSNIFQIYLKIIALFQPTHFSIIFKSKIVCICPVINSNTGYVSHFANHEVYLSSLLWRQQL